MRTSPQLCAFAAFLALLGGAVRAGERAEPAPAAAALWSEGYRIDALEPVPAAVPEQIRLLPDEGPEAWPDALRAALAERILAGWDADAAYGAIHAGLGVWLRYPLVTARLGPGVLVPVVREASLPIAGRLELPPATHARRVVVLVDASASANALTDFPVGGAAAGSAGTARESIPILEAERRALEHLIDLLGEEWLEFGVIAFGEGTWPIAVPGASAAELRAGLERFRREHPRGEGRTDAVCALWTARDWLADSPEGVEREIILLTDGDLPHSGRFQSCEATRRHAGREAAAVCEARRNHSPCPARHVFQPGRGRSDAKQLGLFVRETRRELSVTPLLFEPDRRATLYERLAADTGGRLVRVPAPEAIEVALPALVARRIRGVFARNATTGATSADLRSGAADPAVFAGALALAPGANDVELRIESDRGLAGLMRFRIWHDPDPLGRFLAELRARNAELDGALADQLARTREALPQGRRHDVRIDVDEPPPAAAQAAPR